MAEILRRIVRLVRAAIHAGLSIESSIQKYEHDGLLVLLHNPSIKSFCFFPLSFTSLLTLLGLFNSILKAVKIK